MRRGDIVVVALSGDFGKPRPAILVQSDRFIAAHATLLVCPLTSELLDLPQFRIRISPTSESGLKKASDIMVDKMQAVRRERVRGPIGRLEEPVLQELNESIALFTGLLD